MMKFIATILGATLVASTVMAGAVTNTVKWNVPWGDAYRGVLETTLDTYETQINTLVSGVGGVNLASNKWVVGSSLGKASAVSISGLFTMTTGGVASATSSGLAVTGVTATAAVTPQAPGAVTPTITLTPQTGNAVSSIGLVDEAPSAVTPTITITKQVGTITATAVITPQTVSLTDTNGVTAIVWTNATCAVTIVGGDAVMTNATAASSELPLFLTNTVLSYANEVLAWTNATAASTALPLFATNATAVITVTPTTTTFVKP